MSNTQEASFNVSEEDILEATKAAIGPKAIVESFNSVLIEEPGVGFLGIHFTITVRGRASPGLPVVEVPMFAKMEPPVEGATTLFRAFQVESAFFKKLLGPLNEAFKSADGQESPTWTPKCYLAKENLLIFENITAKGYNMTAEPVVSIQHFRLMFKALARLHTAGLLLGSKIGEEALIKMCPEIRKNVMFSNDFNMAGVYVRNASADALAVILASTLTPDEMPRLKELQEKLHSLSRGLWDDLEKAKVGPLVPLHGDSHLSNFMFKTDEHGNPTDAVLIDFQFTRHHVPALDVLFCLYLSAPPEFVETYSDELIQHYYKCLEEECRRCGSQIEKIFTFEDFLAGAEGVRIPAFYLALMYSTVMQAPRMDLGKILLDPFEHRRFLLGCRAAETSRWFHSDPNYRSKVEKMLRKLLELSPTSENGSVGCDKM